MNMIPQINTGDGNGVKSAESMRRAEGSQHNDFLAQLNHELLPPLNAIINFTEHLDKQCDDASMIIDIKSVLRSANDLLDVINRRVTELVHDPNVAKAQSIADSHCDVLHIEDDPIIFASVKLLLESNRKLKVLRAINGEEGVALAQTCAPKLVLLDLDLPDIHGSEVIQRLQKEPATARIPVVVLSGDATPSQIERLLILGARNYLTKPFKIPALLAVVDGILEKTSHSN
jgi:CheY-like chemotaxis protein